MTTFHNKQAQIQTLVVLNDLQQAAALLRDFQEADSAAILDTLDQESAFILLRSLALPQQAQVFSRLAPHKQIIFAQAMERAHLIRLIEHMDPDDRVDVYKRLDEPDRIALLPGLAHAEREDIRQLAQYPEGTVGSVMTSSYVTLRPNKTVREALETLRLEAPDQETIYQSYVVDEQRRLCGTVSLRQLILADPNRYVSDLMTTDVIRCDANEERSTAAHLIAHYDLLAVPVINAQQQIVGIVTHDDALDLTTEDSTEDQFKLGAVGKLQGSFLHASIRHLFSMRVGWLVVLVFGNIFSGAGIAHFEELIESMVALVFFLPLLVDSGGNAGSQSATLMVRALATGEVKPRDWAKLLSKEVAVSVLLGITMAIAVSLIGIVRAGPEVTIVVALTMVLIVITGSVIGMSLPFLLTRLHLDPASASAPLITSICDGVGVLIYFNIASLLLTL